MTRSKEDICLISAPFLSHQMPIGLVVFNEFTYNSGVDHRHELGLDLILSDCIEVHTSLVREENSVLPLDHRSSDSEEDYTD